MSARNDKGHSAKPSDPRAVKFCLLGALSLAHITTGLPFQAVLDINELLREATEYKHATVSLIDFNDHVAQHSDILWLLDVGISQLRMATKLANRHKQKSQQRKVA